MNENNKSLVEKIILLVLLLIITIVLVFQFFQIETLKSDIGNLINEVDNSVENCNNSINNLSSSFEEAVKKQNSIISSVSYEYGELKEDNRTAEIIISVTPKKHTEDTIVTVKINEKTLNAKRTDESTFTAIYEVDVFESREAYDFVTVTVTSNGISTTEIVDDFTFGDYTDEEYIDMTALEYQYLPFVSFDEIPRDVGYEGYSYLDGTLFNYSPEDVKNARLVIEVNGKVCEDKPIDLGKEEISIQKEYKVNEGDTELAYVTYEDVSHGYTYKIYLKTIIEGEQWVGDFSYVYDKDGKLLNAETDNFMSEINDIEYEVQ